MLIHNANVTGSMHLNGMDMSSITGSVSSTVFNQYTSSTNEFTGSANTRLNSLDSASGSFSTRVTSLESFSSSLDATFATDAQLSGVSESLASRLTSDESNITNNSSSFASRLTTDESNISALQTASGSFSTRTTNLETASGSFSTRVTNAEGSITSINSKTGSFATIEGPNSFNGSQTITGSLFVTENLTVLGSSSISYVSQSNLNIGTNLITVNAQNPSVRFGGLAVIDSGSVPQVSGSWLFDSIQNRWIMIHEQTGGIVTSSIALMGPETYNNLGNETQITQNRIIKGSAGASGEHVGDSQISDDGTTVSIPGKLVVTGSFQAATVYASSLTGSINGSYLDNSSVQNAKLANSSVTVTAGSGLSGGGSVALGSSITLTNAGVTSNVAGTGISVSGTTGAVTITNTAPDQTVTLTNGSNITITGTYPNFTLTNGITNNNQLTNGAGYITGISSSMVTTALGYTPVTNARTLTINGVSYDLSADRTWSIAAGVSSFNTRTGAITLTAADVTGSLGYTPVTNARTLTINGTAYDLSADRSWTIAAGVSSITAGTGISVSGTGTVTVTNTGLLSAVAGSGISVSTVSGTLTVTNTGILSGVAGSGISVSTTSGTLTITNTGILSGLAGSGISVSTTSGTLTITNTGLLSGVAGSGISVSTSSGTLTITNTGLLSAVAGSGISVSTTSGTLTITNTITNNNQLTNGAGYITGLSFDGLSSKTGGTGTYQTSGDFRAPIFYDSDNTGYYLNPAGTSYLYSTRVVNDVTTDSGQGRFGGWYTGTGYTGAAVEVGFSGGNGNVISYNRISSAYQPLYIAGSNLYLQQQGGLVYINSQLVRQSAGVGWLSGGYGSAESTTTTGAIYSIGGSYYPTSTSLNNMYGIGYTYGGVAGLGASSAWGLYIAAGGTTRVFLDADSGIGTATASWRAPIFYDSNDTTYYVDPASTSVLNDLRINSGATQLVASNVGRNTKWRGLDGSTDVGISFYNNNNTWAAQLYANAGDGYGFLNGNWASWDMKKVVNGVLYLNNQTTYYYDTNVTYMYRVYGTADMRSPIYYDLDNTGYYIDPASTSNLNALNVGGNAVITTGNYSSYALPLSGGTMTGAITTPTGTSIYIGNQNVSTSARLIINWHTDSDYNYLIGKRAGAWTQPMDITFYTGIRYHAHQAYGGHIFYTAGYDNTQSMSIGNGDSHVRVLQNFYAPIMYDYNNTGYYLDPASTSNLNVITSNTINVNAGYSFVAQGYNNNGGFAMNNASTYWGMMWNYAANDWRLGYGTSVAIGSGGWNLRWNNGSSVWTAGDLNVGAYLYVTGAGSSSSIFMSDTDEGQREIHCNSNRIGFLTQGGSWGAWLYDSADWEAAASSRAPIFYDSNNTGYYVDPASTSNLNALTVNSTLTAINGIQMRRDNAANTGISWYSTSYYNWQEYMASAGATGCGPNGNLTAPGGLTNVSSWALRSRMEGVGTYGWLWEVSSGGAGGATASSVMELDINGILTVASSHRAPIFYDYNDTGYYLDPNSTSDSALRIRGGALHGPNPTWGKYLLVGGDGRQNRIDDTNVASVCTTNGNLHLDAASGYATYINHYDGSTIYFGGGANNNWGEWSGGIFYSYADTRSPIYYDYNDTAYYVNPNGTARLSYVAANAGIRIDGNEDLYLDYNYGCSIVSVYSSNRYQGVYSMGNSYKLARDGTTTGNLYGIAWSYPGDRGGASSNLASHGMLILENGAFKGAWGGGSLRTPGTVWGTAFYDWNDTGYYLDPNGACNVNSMRAAEYRGNANVGGTGEATWHPAGIYCGSTMWQYGAMYKNYTAIYDAQEIYNHGWFRNYGDSGLYNQSYGCHFRRNTASSYGTWEIFGYNKGGYAGLLLTDPSGYWNNLMYESGNGGLYQENGSGWHFYWHRGNACMGIGTSTTSSSYKLYVNGAIYATGNICAYSDIRKKENIETIDNALDKVTKMRGVYYNRTDDEAKKKQTGVIAQEINEILPEVVNYAADVDEYSVAYGNIVGILIEAIKEQQVQIDELKALLNK